MPDSFIHTFCRRKSFTFRPTFIFWQIESASFYVPGLLGKNPVPAFVHNENMHGKICAVAALLAGLAVAAGAFGAHGLKSSVTPEHLEVFKTGAQYLLVHSIAVVSLGLAGRDLRGLKIPLILLVAGSMIFSASLFILVIAQIRVFGAIAPIGGSLMIAGWLSAAYQLALSQSKPAP